MRIVFVGPPGSGKGTQAQRLTEYLDVAHLSTGEMLREAAQAGTEFGRQAAAYFRTGELVPDEVVIGIVAERLERDDCRRGCLFDGFPRTGAQAEALDALLAERNEPLDLVLELQVPDDEVVRRLSQRGRIDDHPDAVQQRIRQYHQVTAPLGAYYRRHDLLRTIDGMGTEQQVFERIRAAIDAEAAPR